MAMLTTAFDASGSRADLACTVVAGFISTAKEWTVFAEAWKARLAEDGLAEFRMSEFTAHRGPFADSMKWPQVRRDRLIAELIDITIRSAFRKFGSVVLHPALAQMPPDIRHTQRITAYSLAGRTCAADVYEWARREPGFHGQIEYVFEDGDDGKGALITRLETDGFPRPVFKPKRDTQKQHGLVLGFLPLQAADIYAYELRVRVMKLHVDRRSYQALNAIPGDARAFTENSVRTFMAGLIPPEDQTIVIPK